MAMPSGYRAMSEVELSRLTWGAMVTILDTHSGHVANAHAITDAKDASVTVKFRGGHVETVGAADVEGQFVPVVFQLAEEIEDPNNALLVALRASNEIAKLKGRLRVAEQTMQRMADEIQGRPTMQQYEAVIAELSHLRDDIRVLQLRRAS